MGLRRYLPHGLFGRALIIIVAPMVIMQLVAAFVFYDRHLEQVLQRLARSVTNDIVFLVDSLDEAATPEADEALLKRATRQLNMSVSLRRSSQLEPFQWPGATPLERILLTEVSRGLNRSYSIRAQPELEAYRIEVAVPEGVLVVLVPFNRFTAPNASLVLYWSVGTALLVLAIAVLFMRNQIRPIRRLAEAAERFGRGQDVGSFKPSGAAEVRQAAQAFLVMRDRIQRQIRQRTEMLAGVGHDLRTPLTRLKLELEMLGPVPGVADMRTDLEEMERMIDGYLAFARGADGEAAAKTDVARLLAEVVEAARRDGARVELETAGDLTAWLKPQALKRCLTNLVDNARRYAGRTWIRAGREPHLLVITVDDDGPGIPPPLREEVFRPFFRIEGSRNQDTGGVGLGLSVARDAIRSHGGDLLLEQAPGGGLRAVVRLPV